MKRILALAAATILAATFVSGCKKRTRKPTSKPVWGSYHNFKIDRCQGGHRGCQVDSVAAAVTVDKDGRIVKCVIDSAQTRINFDATGKITTRLIPGSKPRTSLAQNTV